MTINWIASDQCSSIAFEALRRMSSLSDREDVSLNSLECARIIEYIESLIDEEEDEFDLGMDDDYEELEKEVESLKAQLEEAKKENKTTKRRE